MKDLFTINVYKHGEGYGADSKELGQFSYGGDVYSALQDFLYTFEDRLDHYEKTPNTKLTYKAKKIKQLYKGKI